MTPAIKVYGRSSSCEKEYAEGLVEAVTKTVVRTKHTTCAHSILVILTANLKGDVRNYLPPSRDLQFEFLIELNHNKI